MTAAYETVVGLEVHAQLSCRTKLFCGCATHFGSAVNTQTCPVCLGLPGSLPVLNAQAVTLALRAAVGLGCRVQPLSVFARKHYFYPDLPKGYQITQHDLPYALGGELVCGGEVPLRLGLTRIHIEEDAGKTTHDEAGARASWVDFNRGGTPLIEVVTEPQLRSSAEAQRALKALRQLLRALGVCDGNMEEGSLRCDANVSVRRRGQAQLGTRVELKNINSFRFVGQAIDFEAARQAQLLEAGGRVVQQTRLWDSQAKVTRPMRDKEEAADYRYMPEPDLPPLQLAAEEVAAIAASLPELPVAKAQRLAQQLQLAEAEVALLCEDDERLAFFEAACAVCPRPRAVANWVINELLRELKERPLAQLPLTPAGLGELVALVEEGAISGRVAKDLFAHLVRHGGQPRALVAERGLGQVGGAVTLGPWIDAVLAEQGESVAKYRAGKRQVLGFLVGLVMKKSGGRANPRQVSAMVVERLAAPPDR